MFIDTHCHLASETLYSDAWHWIKRAQQVGVTKIIVPATSPRDFEQVLSLEKPAHIYCALGMHPYYVDANWQAQLTLLEAKIQARQPTALGEIGLDFYLPQLTTEQKHWQTQALIAQLKLAQQYDLPVLLHNRKSVYLCITLLKQYPVKGGIAHAFSGSAEEANELSKLGIKLGIGTMLCRPNTPKLARLAQNLADNTYVLETDAPDMAPVSGMVNYPENIPVLAQKLATLRQQSVEEIAQISSANACSVLSL